MFVFLARVVVFIIVISVIRSVVAYIQRLWHTAIYSKPDIHRPMPKRPQGDGGASSATVLQQDPVCGMYVAVDTSLKKIVSGKVYHFCSEDCRQRFTL